MRSKPAKTLRGLTWKHDRGLAPLLATAREFGKQHDVTIEWEARSLQEFGEAPLEVLSERYDLVVLDHPFMGQVAQEKSFLALDQHLAAAQSRELEADSLGPSFASYRYDGHQWALPIDAAAQVAGCRADLLDREGLKLPETWPEVLDLAKFRRGFVSAALYPLDAVICFFTVCANLSLPAFSRDHEVVAEDVGREALERLRLLAAHSVEGALSMNPIALWERMSSCDDIAYCPLAFGYSNYARQGYRAKLISFCPIPSNGQGPKGSTLGGTGLAISQHSKHLELALGYALWIAGGECQRTRYVESGGQPASRAAWLDQGANQITNGYFAATLPVLEQAWLRPRFRGFERFQVRAAGIVSEFLRSQSSARETLAAMNGLYRSARPPG